MIYCKLRGGLGNMLFQVATTIAFGEQLNTECCFTNVKNHLQYLNEETFFNPSLKHAEEYNFIFDKFKSHSIPENLHVYEYPFEYIPHLPTDNSLIEGYFQSEKYFINSRESILKILNPTQNIEEEINKQLSFLPPEFNAIHVRLGDYLKLSHCHANQSLNYYYEAMEKINSNHPYVIFSDSIDLCKQYFKDKKYCFFNNKDYIDLYVMSKAKNFIISNSSYGWWGAWMNNDITKIVYAPKNWFGPNLKHQKTEDIIPKSWNLI